MPPPDATRQRIIAAAYDLFTSSSYAKVSVNNVADRAGVSKGGLFHHFPSKYALATESLFWHIEEQVPDRNPHEEGGTPEDRVRKIIDVSLHTIVQDTSMIRLFLDLYEEALDTGANLEDWQSFFDRYTESLAGAFEEMGAPEPRARALLLMAALDGFSLYYAFLKKTNREMCIEDIRKVLIDIFRLDERIEKEV